MEPQAEGRGASVEPQAEGRGASVEPQAEGRGVSVRWERWPVQLQCHISSVQT